MGAKSAIVEVNFLVLVNEAVLTASKIGHHVRKLLICQPYYITRFITRIDFSAVTS